MVSFIAINAGSAVAAEESQELPVQPGLQAMQHKSVKRQVGEAGLLYGCASGVLRGVGTFFHRISDAPTFSLKELQNLKKVRCEDYRIVNALEYPKNYYNDSLLRHLFSKVARTSLTLSSVCISPIRSMAACAIMPVALATDYVETWHKRNNPKLSNNYRYSLNSELRSIRTAGVMHFAKAALPMLVGFAPVIAYNKLKNSAQAED